MEYLPLDCLVHVLLKYIMNFVNENVMGQRQAAQCVGRVIRSKADYGMMIFADKRFVSLLCEVSFLHEKKTISLP